MHRQTGEAKLLQELTQRIDPQRSIDKKAFEVHKISEADLVGKPTFEQVAPSISRILDRCEVVVAHNGLEFDFLFLIQEFERVGEELPDFEPFDTMMSGCWATAFGEVPSLKKLCFACDVEYDADDAHAADYDVDKMMESFFFGVGAGRFKLDNPNG